MITPLLAEAPATPNDAARSVERRGAHPFALAVGSALMLWAAFPPAGWSWLAWGALAPLFLLVVSRRSAWVLYPAAWLGGMVFWTLAVQWVRLTDESAWLGWLVMALVLSFFWPAFLWLSRLAVIRLALPVIIVAPVTWVALEYVRAYFVTGFPWYYLAHTQHRVVPLIQIADFSGSLGISLLIALVNAWAVDLLTLPLLRPTPRGARLLPLQALRLTVVAGALLGTVGYGVYRVGTSKFRAGPRVALLQSSLTQRLKMGASPKAILARYEALVERALRGPARPDVIVWPETSNPYPYITILPGLPGDALDRQARAFAPGFDGAAWRTRGEGIALFFNEWTNRIGLPMLVGSIHHVHRPAGHERFNTALLFEPGKKEPWSYEKFHLVPFGEYVPLVQTFPWLTALTPYHGSDVPSLAFGPGPSWLDLGVYRIAPLICFEDTVPQLVRRFFAEVPDGREPDVLLNLSNDGWFGGSEEHEMHLAASIFRAVENRVPLARSVNTGISAIVDGNGRVVVSLATLEEGVLSGVVPLDDRTSLYTFWGDWLGKSCLAVTIGLVPLSVLLRKNRRRVQVT